jgi:ribonuclease E
MTIKMLINAVDEEEYRVAMIKDGLLDGFYVETMSAEQKVGNIYKGVIEHIQPSLQACFVDFGEDRNGFLQISDIHPEYYMKGSGTFKENEVPSIGKVIKKGQEMLVEVTKEMPGKKGPQLTTYVSLASRHLVLTPGRTNSGVSRQIEDEEERKRLKKIMKQFKLPDGVGFIVRTAALNQNKRVLLKDLNRLLRMWKDIKKKASKAQAKSLVHKEQDLCFRTLRDYFSSEITEVLVDDKETHSQVKEYMRIISPRHQRRVKIYKGKRPLFSHYEIEKQLETLYSSRVILKSGGSIVIDLTEALISIDVNSGRGKKGKTLESTAYKTNLEAAVEIARQLRLRDIGGLAVIDFIDMRDRSHIREVEKVFKEEMKKDRAKVDTSHISKFGLLELSRQRLRPSLESRSFQKCHHCGGRGVVQSVESASLSYLRQIWMGVSKKGITQVKGILPLEVATYLQNRKRKEILELESRYGVEVILKGDPSISPGDGKLEFLKEGEE